MADNDGTRPKLNPNENANNQIGGPPPPKRTIIENGHTPPDRFPKNAFEREDTIGKGKFGIVTKGSLQVSANQSIIVASKSIVNPTSVSPGLIKNESDILARVGKHPNIVRGIGVLINEKDEPISVLMELVNNGRELKSLLKDRSVIGFRTKIRLLFELSSAVEHMDEIGVVHRDIAARNIIVDFMDGKCGRLKLCDFGLAKLVDPLTKEYHGPEENVFPHRWSAPESIEKRVWSSKSDVWAIMVVAWELFETDGAEPYVSAINFSTDDEWLGLLRIERLEFPTESEAPSALIKDVNDLAGDCWKWEASDRPTAECVRARFGHMLDKDYGNVVKKALCLLKGDKGVSGCVRFEQNVDDGPTKIAGEIRGLVPGKHGFSIHVYGNCTNGSEFIGAHFNPYKKTHGAPEDTERHVGDMGNLVADSSGMVKLDMLDKVITLSGPNSVIGRSLVIHEKEDDLGKGGDEESFETGNAGATVASGVIGIAAP